MWSPRKPSDDQLRALVSAQADARFTYSEVGATATNSAPDGFDFDLNRILLGRGETAFIAACAALRQWRQFPRAWTQIHPDDTPLKAGQPVALVIRALGVWWINTCRIVYVVDETGATQRFGFAYGTLPAHVERGEERFTIELDAAGNVWYEIRAFSRPRMLLARMGYPIARRLQRKFVRDSQAAMLIAVNKI